MRRGSQRGRGAVLIAVLLLTFLPIRAESPFERALQQFERGSYEAAVQSLQAEFQKHPQDARLLYWLCRSYFELRDFDKAILYGDGAVRTDNRSEYWFWLGKAYGRKAQAERSLGLARKSKAAFEKAVELDPTHIAARRALIEYLAEAPAFLAGGSKSKAREHIAVLASQDQVQAHLAWGEYWVEEKELDAAEKAYRATLDLKPKDVEPYFEVAGFYIRTGNAAQMEAVVETAAKVNASDVRLHFYRGVARVLAGNRFGEAERFLKTYLEKSRQRSDFPSHAAAHEWLGKLYERQNRCGDAVQQYRTALELQPRRRDPREALKRLKCS